MLKHIGISAIVAVLLLTASFSGVNAAPSSIFDTAQSSAADDISFIGPINHSIRCITQNGSIVMCCWRTGENTWRCEDQ